MIVIKAACHVHVNAGKKTFARGRRPIIGYAMRNELPNRFPIAVNYAAESPFLAQNLLKRKRSCGSRHSVDRVECAHNGRGSGIHRSMKRGEIVLTQRMLRDFGGVVIASALSTSVPNVMFRA